MAVRIPESPRVIYASNPLVDVICQVRFPRILVIDTESPAAFQEAIRKEFPIFGETLVEVQVQPPDWVVSPAGPTKVYTFESEDRDAKVTLTSEFVALSTRRYERWELFINALAGPLQALFEIYRPTLVTRIGLRYIDIIQRSKVGLEGVPWSGLLQGWVFGDFGNIADESDLLGASRDALLQLEGGARLRLRHGLARTAHDAEVVYRIDTDFYLENAPDYRSSEAVLDALQRFNGLSGRLFRHMIQPRLHEAMGPQGVSP